MNVFSLQFSDWTILLTLEMQAFGGDLFEMDLHEVTNDERLMTNDQ
jgi:hypothetical protein